MRRILFVPVLVCMAMPLGATAQTGGAVELMGFGRFTRISPDRELNNAIGVGGGLGLFFSSRFKITGDVSYGFTKDTADTSVGYAPFHARLVYEQPLSDDLRATIGGGYVFNAYTNYEGNDQGWTVALGLNKKWREKTRLFVQGTMDFMPPNWNDLRVVVAGNPPGVVRIIERADINWGIEAGISRWFFGRSGGQPVVAAAPPPQQRPVTPPAQQQQPPQRVEPPVTPTPAPTQPQPQPQPPVQPQPQPERFVDLVAIHFDFDSAELRPDARAELDRAVGILRANGSARVQLEGHADERGSSAYNQRLGQRRAAAVRAYLTENGITEARLSTVSRGESRPVDPAKDESAYARNRRVELVVLDGARLREPR